MSHIEQQGKGSVTHSADRSLRLTAKDPQTDSPYLFMELRGLGEGKG